MAGVRDPAFWKRFSMAVHMDEENGSQGQTELKHRYTRSYTTSNFIHSRTNLLIATHGSADKTVNEIAGPASAGSSGSASSLSSRPSSL